MKKPINLRHLNNHASQFLLARSIQHTVWVAAVTAAVIGCGARVDKGNTGSETHWLDECKRDAECGAESCLCESCTRGCTTDADCRIGNVAAKCVANADLKQASTCDTDTPSRVCAAPSAITTAVTLPSGDAASTAAPDPSGDAAVPAPSEMSMVELPSNPKICDGSDAIRLVVHRYIDGLFSGPSLFTGANGTRFLAIDGHCNFWISTELGIVREGTLLDTTPLAAYETTTYGKLGNFSDFRPMYACQEGYPTVLWDPSGVTADTCGLQEPTPPAGWVEAFIHADELMQALAAVGELSRGPLRVIFDREENTNEATTWPLALDLAAVIPKAPLANQDYWAPDAGFLFKPGEDAEALRTARNSTNFSSAVFLLPLDAGAAPSVVGHMRDELPLRVKTALDYAGSLANSTDACIRPEDPAWACTDDSDCCGGLHCCTDCGDRSGLCVDDPDPCATCLENGGNWMPRLGTGCAAECPNDIECFSDACPAACAPDNCGGCFNESECWVAGCDWSNAGGSINETCRAFTSL
jgi:hypothetical protein